MLRTFAIIVTNVHELKFKDIGIHMYIYPRNLAIVLLLSVKGDDPFVKNYISKQFYNLTLHGNVFSCFRQAEKSIVIIQ